MADFQHEFEQLEAQLRQANDEINRRSGRPLLPAILTGLALGGLVVLGLFFPVVFGILAVAIVVFGAFELATALRQSGRRIPRIPLVVIAAGIVAAAFLGGEPWHWIALLIGCVVLATWRLVELAVPRLRTGARGALVDIAASVFALVYVPFMVGFIVLLIEQDEGWRWVLGFLIVIVINDIAAYAVGRTLGRHPMAPRVSPNKSWEGFAGSAVASLVAGCLVAWLLLLEPWWLGLPFGAVLLLSGTLGDLAESLIKRDLGVKDMSSWLPGHGGILDRIDGILLSAPFAFAMYLLVA